MHVLGCLHTDTADLGEANSEAEGSVEGVGVSKHLSEVLWGFCERDNLH